VIVGFANTAIDWTAFTLLYGVLGVEARFAQIAAQSLAMANSYIANKLWTFRSGREFKKAEILRFILLQLFILCVGYAGMALLAGALNPYICKLMISAVTVALNYLGNRLFVFK